MTSSSPRPLPHTTRRHFVQTALALAAMGSFTACTTIRLGSSAPPALPTASPDEAARDSLARSATLVASLAQQVAGSTDPLASAAAEAASRADSQIQALGGVWQPWASAPPTDYPTVPPVPTATPGSGSTELLEALNKGLSEARHAVTTASEPSLVQLACSMGLGWSLDLVALGAPPAPVPRSAGSLTQALPDALLLSYDQARYALEDVAARASDPQRAQARADAAVATTVVRRSLALGSEDTRLPAYAPPAPDEDTSSTDVAWAQRVWLDVMTNEVVAAPSLDTESREASTDAAVDAAIRALAWGATISEALPGFTQG